MTSPDTSDSSHQSRPLIPPNPSVLSSLSPIPATPANPPIVLSPHTPTPESSAALHTLTNTYVTAFETASRMGLGVPLRVEVKTGNGSVVVQNGIVGDEEGQGASNDEEKELLLVGTSVGQDEVAARVSGWAVERVGGKVVGRA